MDDWECLFFGCWRTTGHGLYDKEGISPVFKEPTISLPFDWRKLDTGFIADHCKWKEGHATLTYLLGYTVLSFPDNSIDTRPASHSTYLIKGHVGFDGAVKIAERNFPKIWSRYWFDLLNKSDQ